MIFVYSSRPSRGARVLARALKGRRVRDASRIRPNDIVINWGDSQCPVPALNKREAVGIAANKLLTFDALKGSAPIPEYARTTDGVSWHSEHATVVRHLLQGHSGAGIEIIEPGKELPSARLYVRYIKKAQEYRVHVVKETVVLVQRKARNTDVGQEAVNWQIRNHDNGFIYQRNGVVVPTGLEDAARQAISALGLDFGAVDLIVTKAGKVFVLEVNTAPGLEGSTVNDYAKGFQPFLDL